MISKLSREFCSFARQTDAKRRDVHEHIPIGVYLKLMGGLRRLSPIELVHLRQEDAQLYRRRREDSL